MKSAIAPDTVRRHYDGGIDQGGAGMIYIVLNVMPIAAATMAGLLIGWIWLRLAGLAVPGAAVLVAIAAAEFWFAAILAGALILAPAKASAWVMAIGSAIVIWIGFVAPATIVTQAARRASAKVIALDCGHWLAVMMIQALVLKSIGLVPPPA